jgi:hypothetical protein
MTYGMGDLEWRGDRLCRLGREYARIEPDATCPGMWRRVRANGGLSGMVNRTRARDAARAIVLGILNRQEKAAEVA